MFLPLKGKTEDVEAEAIGNTDPDAIQDPIPDESRLTRCLQPDQSISSSLAELLAFLEGGIKDAKVEMDLCLNANATIPEKLWNRGKAIKIQKKLLETYSTRRTELKDCIRQALDADDENLVLANAKEAVMGLDGPQFHSAK